MIEGTGGVLVMEVGQDVGAAGEDAHSGAPAVGRVGGAEPGSDFQWLLMGSAGGLEAKDGLGDDEADVVFQAVLESLAPVLGFIAGLGTWIDPDLAVNYRDGEAAHVVGEGVEGAATGEVETGVVPVAGENAVPDAAAV